MSESQASSAPPREGEGVIADAERRYLEALRSVEEMQRTLGEAGRASAGKSPAPEAPGAPPANPSSPPSEAARARPAAPPRPRTPAPPRPAEARPAAPAPRPAPETRASTLRRVGVGLIVLGAAILVVGAAAWWRSTSAEDPRGGARSAEDADVSQPAQRGASEEPAGSASDAAAEPSRTEPDEGGDATGAVRMRRYVNEAGGYSFSYPAGWELLNDGEVSKVRSPDGHLVVSFALGPVGLPVSYDGFAALLQSSFEGVRIGSIEPVSVAGHRSVEVRGVAGEGGRVTFRALLVERGEQRSVGAFAATDTGTFDPRLDHVLASLRP